MLISTTKRTIKAKKPRGLPEARAR
jgi:hypothetical protein